MSFIKGMRNVTGVKRDLRMLSSKDLALITDNFSEVNILGTGQRWKLYRGMVVPGMNCGEAREVTVKLWDDVGKDDICYFEDEMQLLTCPRMSAHPILVKLFGYCCEDRTLAFVYELAAISTMHDQLSARICFLNVKFTMPLRFKAAFKLARALAFFHKQDPPFILHNLEPAHILLDSDLNPKLFDFGRTCGVFADRIRTHHAIGAGVHTKSVQDYSGAWLTDHNVFDFGTILLKLFAIRMSSFPNLPLPEAIDADNKYTYNSLICNGRYSNDAIKAINLALSCVDFSCEKRPSMQEVVAHLKRLYFIQKVAWFDRGMKHSVQVLRGFPKVKQPKSLSSKDVQLITDHFNKGNLLGPVNSFKYGGSSGKIYRGMIKKGRNCDAQVQEVTVKIWNSIKVVDCFRKELEDEMVFLTLPSMSFHPNLVKLIGYCREDESLCLIYELASSSTLQNRLSDVNYTWAHRIKAALGIAHALAFLHGQDPPLILRNLDPTHIILDKDFNPRLFEFGLTTGGIFGDRRGYRTQLIGSYGFIDPTQLLDGEFKLIHGLRWTTSTNVYVFGIILLALISSRPVFERGVPDSHVLNGWVNKMWMWNKCNIVAKRFRGTPGFYGKDATRIRRLALRCVRYHPEKRPTMEKVVRVLEGLHITPKLVLFVRNSQ